MMLGAEHAPGEFATAMQQAMTGNICLHYAYGFIGYGFLQS